MLSTQKQLTSEYKHLVILYVNTSMQLLLGIYCRFLFDENKTIGKDVTMTHCLNSVLPMIDWTMQTHGAYTLYKLCTYFKLYIPFLYLYKSST